MSAARRPIRSRYRPRALLAGRATACGVRGEGAGGPDRRCDTATGGRGSDMNEQSASAALSAAHPFSLAGRVALVTGSRRGIGLAIADALMRAGAHVVLHGRDDASLAASVHQFETDG